MNFKSKNILFFLVIFFFFVNSFLLNASSGGLNVNLDVGGCNNNGICEAGQEDFFSCPADCTPIVVPPSHGSGGSGSLAMDNVFNNLTVEVSYNSAIIRWKSVIPTMSNIKWGTNPDYKDGVVKNINFLLDHKVELTGLKDGTLYYFNIQAENLLGKTNSLENQVFRTLSLLDNTPPSNPTNVKGFSNALGITISWTNPKETDFDYIRVMRNTDRYYSSPFVGYLVYEGNGTYFTDSKVVEGVRYYYTLFARDRAGNYSSGALISIVQNGTGKDTWGTDLTPIEKVEPVSATYLVSQDSSVYDFKMGSIFSLSGDQPIEIRTNYSPKNIGDDMWLDIRDSDKSIVGQYFFFRTKDKDGFTKVIIPFFDEKGKYSITIHRYSGGVSQIVNQGVFQISKVAQDNGLSFSWYLLWFILLILLIFIIFLFISYKIYKRFKKNRETRDLN